MKKRGIPWLCVPVSLAPFFEKTALIFAQIVSQPSKLRWGPLSSSWIYINPFTRPISKVNDLETLGACALQGYQDRPAKAGVVPEKSGLFTSLSASMAGTNRTPVLEGILTSNSISHHPWVGSEPLIATPFGDARQSRAYSFVLGCTDESWEDGKAA